MPIDVVTQRIMVSDLKGTRYQNGLDCINKIWNTEGFRGFYRGLGLTVLSWAPTSAIWWGTYTAIRPEVGRVASDPKYEVLTSGACGAVAGSVSAVLSNPIDVIKTRLQTIDGTKKKSFRAFSVTRKLVKQEGMSGFTKGLAARMINSALVSFVIINTYESVKRLSLTTEQPVRNPVTKLKQNPLAYD